VPYQYSEDFQDDWEAADKAEKRFLREMCEDSYVMSNWVEVPEFTAPPRKPIQRMQMSLFDDQEVA
jgi:hypothetical protein